LPPKVTFEEWVDVPSKQRAAYREAVLARNLMAMRRSVTVSGEAFASAKMARLEELLAEHRENGRKVLVFSFFLPVLDEIERRFSAVGSITGAVSGDERMALIDRFQEADGHALLACQIQAGGVGLNLQAASVVVLMEPQWKPTTEWQAIARAHRMGQTRRVTVHRLLARDAVDQRMLELVREKSDLFEAYARESLVKDASPQASEAQLTKQVIAAERERLGIPAQPEDGPGA
jgi:SNF2 family DNA or RNA helicase